jgi:hypothetical protein
VFIKYAVCILNRLLPGTKPALVSSQVLERKNSGWFNSRHNFFAGYKLKQYFVKVKYIKEILNSVLTVFFTVFSPV